MIALPDGPRLAPADDERYPIEPPPDDPERRRAIGTARDAVGGIERVTWAVLRPAPPGVTRDVLVVTPSPGVDEAVTVAAFTDAVA